MSSVTNTVAVAVETFAFRAIIRGNLPSGARVRRVRNVQCPAGDIMPALAALEVIQAEITKTDKLTNVFATVYPPVGYKLTGALSKGWAVAADGSIERVKA